jgi:hypothetical protein
VSAASAFSAADASDSCSPARAATSPAVTRPPARAWEMRRVSAWLRAVNGRVACVCGVRRRQRAGAHRAPPRHSRRARARPQAAPPPAARRRPAQRAARRSAGVRRWARRAREERVRSGLGRHSGCAGVQPRARLPLTRTCASRRRHLPRRSAGGGGSAAARPRGRACNAASGERGAHADADARCARGAKRAGPRAATLGGAMSSIAAASSERAGAACWLRGHRGLSEAAPGGALSLADAAANRNVQTFVLSHTQLR